MTSKFSYHGALAPLGEACDLAGDDFVCVSHLMAGGGSGVMRQLVVAWRHFVFALTLLRYSGKKCILVRDFSNIPLACVFPIIFWKRRDLCFLVNHNLQWTLSSKAEKLTFRWVGLLGGRFVFFEQVPVDVLSNLGLNAGRYASLPHPVPDSQTIRNRVGGVATVGVVGQYRLEKGVDEMLERLKPLADRFRIILAFPNPQDFLSQSRLSQESWFSLVDTSGLDDFQQTIAACDVVVLNHPAEHYSCRASGLVADAVAAHVPVIARNLPMIRNQVKLPCSIGECFDDLSELGACIERVSSGLSSGVYDFCAYQEGRSVSVLVQQLKTFCR